MESSSVPLPGDDTLPRSPTTAPLVEYTSPCCGDNSLEIEAQSAPADLPPVQHPSCTHHPESCGAASHHSSQCGKHGDGSRLQSKVLEIMRSEMTSAEKGARIHTLFLEQREAVLPKPSPDKTDQFPGLGKPTKCAHYERKCWIKAECCSKYYACPRCHDEQEDHDIDTKSIRHIGCILCGDYDQPLSATCRACGARFARYFCKPCKMYNDAKDKDCYHCNDCGICRLGKGLGIDNFHCEKCNSCWPLDAKESHPCRPGNFDSNCPICQEHMATTTQGVYVLDCTHAIHTECFDRYVKAGNFACPLCSKSLMNKEIMNDWYRKIDERLVLDEIPEEFRRKKSQVFCNDCETKTIAPFHFRFHKCADCNGYNTTVLNQFDEEDKREEEEQTLNVEEERTLDERHPPPPGETTRLDENEIDHFVDQT